MVKAIPPQEFMRKICVPSHNDEFGRHEYRAPRVEKKLDQIRASTTALRPSIFDAYVVHADPARDTAHTHPLDKQSILVLQTRDPKLLPVMGQCAVSIALKRTTMFALSQFPQGYHGPSDP